MRDTQKKSIYKPKPVSGFPEWLPEVRLVEQLWLDHIRRVFESYGFCSVETPSVEEIGVLQAKGEVDKEIYVLDRLHKEEGDKDARLALHFDQTVPLARYVAQHFNDLVFPFKRYQMQRVWRGERPQAGRFREFTQCDIDVINVDGLPLFFDAEMPAIIWEILSALPGMANEKIQIRISNRKILLGFLDGVIASGQNGEALILNKDEKIAVLREIDKLSKFGKEFVLQRIEDIWRLGEKGVMGLGSFIRPFLDICEKPYTKAEDLEEALLFSKDIDTSNSLLKEGIAELSFVIDQLKHLPAGSAVADLSIIRGLDYYTGTVYETVFLDDPGYGSICSGGRYDDLAGSYINKHLPGVGISIGFSRLFARLLDKGVLPVGPKSPADMLMVLFDESQRPAVAARAHDLRAEGWRVEQYHSPRKLPDQLKYAERKGIPYVYLPGQKGAADEVKVLATRDQIAATPEKLAELKAHAQKI